MSSCWGWDVYKRQEVERIQESMNPLKHKGRVAIKVPFWEREAWIRSSVTHSFQYFQNMALEGLIFRYRWRIYNITAFFVCLTVVFSDSGPDGEPPLAALISFYSAVFCGCMLITADIIRRHPLVIQGPTASIPNIRKIPSRNSTR